MRPGLAQDGSETLQEESRPFIHLCAQDANIEKMILMPTWREMLYDLVHSEQLDPWNIDLADITNKYLERLKKMQTNDLRVPANLILAAAILLRFKSDLLSLKEPVAQTMLDDYMDSGLPPMEIPALELKGRIPPKGRVTLQELVGALERVFSEQKRKSEEMPPYEPPTQMEIKIAGFNIDEHIARVHDKIMRGRDAEGLVAFSSLLDKHSREDVIFTLLPVLFLSNKGAISVAQDPFFGEIFIRLNNGNKADSAKAEKKEKTSKPALDDNASKTIKVGA